MSQLPPLAPDRVLSSQVLIAGQVIDQVTGRAASRGLQVRLEDAASGAPIPGLPLRLVPDEGRFAYAGDPTTFQAALQRGPMSLRLVAAAAGYPAETSVTLSLAESDGSLQALTLTRPFGDIIVSEWAWKDALLRHPLRLVLPLAPAPVLLRGQVTDAASPFGPLAGATVTITVPTGIAPATTDADGFYAFGLLPLVSEVTLKATAGAYKDATAKVMLDYTQPLNICNLVLVHT